MLEEDRLSSCMPMAHTWFREAGKHKIPISRQKGLGGHPRTLQHSLTDIKRIPAGRASKHTLSHGHAWCEGCACPEQSWTQLWELPCQPLATALPRHEPAPATGAGEPESETNSVLGKETGPLEMPGISAQL